MCFCVIVLFCVFVRVLAVRPCACMFPCVFLSIRSCKCLHACVRVCVLCVCVCVRALVRASLHTPVFVWVFMCIFACLFLCGKASQLCCVLLNFDENRLPAEYFHDESIRIFDNDKKFFEFWNFIEDVKKKLIARINKNICIIHSTIWRSHQCNLRRVKECTNNRRSSWRSWFQFFFAEDILNMVKFFSPPPFCLKKSQLWKSCWIWTKRGRPEVMFIESESSQDQKNFFGFQRFHADSRTLN